jgi:hypothetical protein
VRARPPSLSFARSNDRNSIFCTVGANGDYVQNATYRVTISDKISLLGAADGPKYCWSGTFGALVKNKETMKDGWLGTTSTVTASLSCSDQNLFYRQCIINNQLSVVLIVIGTIVWYCCFTCACFYCGCCKCCNNKDDLSAWGMCNRFCPTAPCADPPDKEEVLPEHLVNPKSEEENKSSLFGANKKLNAVRSGGLGELKKPVAADDSEESVRVVVPPSGMTTRTPLPPPSMPPPSMPPPSMPPRSMPPPSMPPPSMPPPAAAPPAPPAPAPAAAAPAEAAPAAAAPAAEPAAAAVAAPVAAAPAAEVAPAAAAAAEAAPAAALPAQAEFTAVNPLRKAKRQEKEEDVI